MTRVVPPAVLFLLKVVSYLDDPQRRAKDLEDIYGLLRFYERNSDRIFSDIVFTAELPDLEFASAFLLGADLATLCRSAARALADHWLTTVSDQSSRTFGLLLQYEGRIEPSEERLSLGLQAFRDGLKGGL